MIIVYTGNGKGKTTAAIGAGIRAIGHGKKVVMIEFMKGQKTGELNLNLPNFEIYQFGTKEFVMEPTEEDKEKAKEGLKFAEKIIENEQPFLLILDEINVAVKFGLIDPKEVIELLKKVKNHVILTGRYAPKEFIEIADLVTEMKEVKHPFKEGKPAVEGIDF